MRVAVVGHVEWIRFARVDHVPAAGEIAHAIETWEEPGGGGAVAAVQLAKLAGGGTLFTALGDDEISRRATRELESLDLRVEAALREALTRTALTLVDRDGERTITTLGDRLEPRADDALAWDLLEDVDTVYVTAGDAAAIRLARRARTLVATSRAMPELADAHVPLDALVGSANDPAETYRVGTLTPAPALVVRTDGLRGGSYETGDGRSGRYDPAPLPGRVADTYGAGDSFHGGLTYGLGDGWDVERALAFAARCGAASVTGRGPYEDQLTASDV